jgi:hypothetical protein
LACSRLASRRYPRGGETLIDYLTSVYTLDDFLEGFPSVSGEQVEVYLETTLEAADSVESAGRR